MPTSTRVPLVFGAGSFSLPNMKGGRLHTVEDCQAALDAYFDHYDGIKVIDTSRIYGGGTSEELLAKLDIRDAVIDTKCAPLAPGDHKPEKLRESLQQSIAALALRKIRVFYLHAPDRSVPYVETLRGINELYKEGLFEEFGISNYASWEVAEIYVTAKLNGWIVPTIYQGVYNALGRRVEAELLPCLRKFGIRFYAYSPLAGGLLTGKILTSEDFDKQKGTRWDTEHSSFATYLRASYTPLLPAFKQIKEALNKHNMRMSEVGFRWLQHHSKLTPEDGIILGTSNPEQVPTNISDSGKGPLPDDILQLIEEAYEVAKGNSEPYIL